MASRGKVRLRSADPRHKPAIDPAYLSDSADLEPRWSRRCGMAREFAAARPLSKICTAELAPGGDVRTDAELRECIRSDIATIYHPVGTCAMGGDSRLAASRLTSVVDPELRVRGIDVAAGGGCLGHARRCPAATPTRRPSPSPSGPPT